MKSLLLLISLLILTACGINGEVQQPITTPTAINGHDKVVSYKPAFGNPSNCYATIYVNGYPLDPSTYRIECEYDSNNRVSHFIVTYYISLPNVAVLQYSIY